MKGSLVKRGKIYHARYWFRGREHWKSTGKTNRKDAEAELAKILAPLNAENAAAAHIEAARLLIREEAQQKGQATEVSEIWDRFVTAPERSDCDGRTLADYRGIVRRFCRWAAEQRPPCSTLDQVTGYTARLYAMDLAAAVGHSTYNKHTSTLRMVWRTLAYSTGWEANPWNQLRRKKYEVSGKRPLTAQECSSLIEAAEGQWRTLMLLGLYTGQRRKDLCLLEWKDVNIQKRLIILRPYKTRRRKNKVAHIPIHRDLLAVLEALPRTSRYVLPEIAETYTTKEQTLTRKIAAIFTRAGIQRISPDRPSTHRRRPVEAGFHSLRHTFVTLCFEDDMPMASAQSIVGHSNPQMTRHYAHVGTRTLITEMDKCDSFTRGKDG